MAVKRPEFKGIRCKCRLCDDLWPAIDIVIGTCPDCKDAYRTKFLRKQREAHPND